MWCAWLLTGLDGVGWGCRGEDIGGYVDNAMLY